jgi:hypothetical protein
LVHLFHLFCLFIYVYLFLVESWEALAVEIDALTPRLSKGGEGRREEGKEGGVRTNGKSLRGKQALD